MEERIREILAESVNVKQKLLNDFTVIQKINHIANLMVSAFRADQKVFFCGNGGSAADAQHLAGELSGRFYLDRDPLFAEALHLNPAYVTAVANDYSYEEVLPRIVRAKGRSGDLLIALSTSGNSQNVLNAVKEARLRGMVTIGLTGKSGGELKDLCDQVIVVPSNDTPRIQEAHMLIGHIVCELVEKDLFG